MSHSIRNKILYRSHICSLRIDMKSYELWPKHFLRKNVKILVKILLSLSKSKLSLKKSKLFIPKNMFDSSHVFFYLRFSLRYIIHIAKLHIPLKFLSNILSKHIFFINSLLPKFSFFPLKYVLTSPNQILHKEKPMFYFETNPGSENPFIS